MKSPLATLVNDCVELTDIFLFAVFVPPLFSYLPSLRYIISPIHHRKGYYEAKFRKEEEGGERESLTLTHLLNNDDTGGDDVYLATLDERKVSEV